MAKFTADGNVIWAQTFSSPDVATEFIDIKTDSDDNIYAILNQSGNGFVNFDTNLTAKVNSEYPMSTIVKYDENGKVVWTQTPTSISKNLPVFNSISLNDDNTICVVGIQGGQETFDYGSNIRMKGLAYLGNPVLLKFNNDGKAIWGRVSSGMNNGQFKSVTSDNEGNIYVAGDIFGADQLYYYNSDGKPIAVTFPGESNLRHYSILLKFSPSGDLLWAQGPSQSSGSDSYYNNVIVDPKGSIMVSGNQGQGVYQYSKDITLDSKSYTCAILAQFNKDGKLNWVINPDKSFQSSGGVIIESIFIKDNYYYLTGSQSGNKDVFYGENVTLKSNGRSGRIPLILQYSNDGAIQWGNVFKNTPGEGVFTDGIVSKSGNLYTTGYQFGDKKIEISSDINIIGVGDGNGLLFSYAP